MEYFRFSFIFITPIFFHWQIFLSLFYPMFQGYFRHNDITASVDCLFYHLRRCRVTWEIFSCKRIVHKCNSLIKRKSSWNSLKNIYKMRERIEIEINKLWLFCLNICCYVQYLAHNLYFWFARSIYGYFSNKLL